MDLRWISLCICVYCLWICHQIYSIDVYTDNYLPFFFNNLFLSASKVFSVIWLLRRGCRAMVFITCSLVHELNSIVSSRMTARERSQFFTDFMAKVMDAPTAKYPNSPETPTFTGLHFITFYIIRVLTSVWWSA